MEYSYSFYIKDVVGNNKIRVILKNLDGSLKVRTLGDLQNYILHSKNYFKFTYIDNSSLIISSGRNLEGYSPELIYLTLYNPYNTLGGDIWSIVQNYFEVVSIEEIVEQKEPKILVSTLTSQSKQTIKLIQSYILNSPNYFKFIYNGDYVKYVTCGKNLTGCNSSRIYNSTFNPPLSEKSGALLCDDWEDLIKVIEMEFPKAKQKESEKMNVTYVTPIEVMQKNPGTTYIVDDGTGKIAFQIIDSELGFTNDIQHFKSWRLAPNIPSNAYPGSIAEMKKINFSPDAQWLNEIVKSGAKFRKQNQTDEIDINAIKKLLPQGWTLNQYADHIVIK